MGRPFDAYDGIACAEIGIYCIYLCGAIYLLRKHGFREGAGWRFLIMLSLARLIGDSMRLATISQPTNRSLYVGWLILLGLGIGPLILTLHGVLGRLIDSMNAQGRAPIKSFHRRLLEILMLGGMVLVIIGGTKSHYTLSHGNPVTQYSSLSSVGTGIIVAVMGLLLLEYLIVFRNRDCITRIEHRVLIAVIICIPFVLVRVAYSCILVFGGVHSSPWLLLGMSTAMEVIVTFICELCGFILPSVTFLEGSSSQDREMQPMGSYGISK
ncbi:uncharacterized protein TRIVIDRAFT_49577 [Trichoderma virens Gv29-8]|uniref:DUF7702 domain-containing protein n=1 Tax=Hypocrea virens (strain Gv29-8 / FGSC 10586) TaxID=413071 RepID=G9N2F5_HYPVG|nr:uncharacterized protein TRIVIDRAFT_49577 [Trichoderma virens Gv29-8]EHK19266.1 hypothetical protein TRIVIDRAFT_49577 [Trichoderma virens Gv29-8]UKZ49279.1 hypothetical protein TrVGV298_003524 [Trichoderma virens]